MPANILHRRLQWPWPAKTVHAGIPLGNATFGALIWGDGAPLKITINRADYWDHHGGIEFSKDANFANLKRLLAEGDEAGLRHIFEGRATSTDKVLRPTRLPMGRIDLDCAPDAVRAGGLHLDHATACLELDRCSFNAIVLRDEPVLAVQIQGQAAARVQIVPKPVDAPEVLEHLRSLGYPEVERFDHGWTQRRPDDDPTMTVAFKRVERAEGNVEVFVCSVFGEQADADALLDRVADAGYDALHRQSADWWAGYWSQAAEIDVPNPDLMLLYYLGLYKLAGLSVPGSPAATLQGPWVEEHRIPPWSGDYHFNINVQECYWPAFASNHVEALEPLWELIESWEPKLRRNAKVFAGIDDGFMLPHAVDDRCTGMGGFWTGAVDHGSTAWTAQLMWLYYRYTMDEAFLRDTAYPMLRGALRVYEAMLEPDGERLQLPIGVSPEYGGAGFGAYGKNASFQLAILHFLCRKVVEASEILGIDEPERERWRDIDRRLPLAATSPDRGQIYIWDGQPLHESHRHHSHLAGLYPFDVFDYYGCDSDRALVAASMTHLTRMGMGLWSGWCVPWASILFARTGQGDMAELLLDIFKRTYMNEGYGSLHDARLRGFTLLAGRPDIMQIEASQAAAAAVMELLVQCAHGVVRVFAAVPTQWRDAAFSRLRTEGAFLVSGIMRGGAIESIEITAEAGGALRLANPFGDGSAKLDRADGFTTTLTGKLFEIEMPQGETVRLTPA